MRRRGDVGDLHVYMYIIRVHKPSLMPKKGFISLKKIWNISVCTRYEVWPDKPIRNNIIHRAFNGSSDKGLAKKKLF